MTVPYTAADYIRDLEADAARWEQYAAQARGPYKQDMQADGWYLARLFRLMAAQERARLSEETTP
jgi:hypothetical protein